MSVAASPGFSGQTPDASCCARAELKNKKISTRDIYADNDNESEREKGRRISKTCSANAAKTKTNQTRDEKAKDEKPSSSGRPPGGDGDKDSISYARTNIK
jgi:hypothetical protein